VGGEIEKWKMERVGNESIDVYLHVTTDGIWIHLHICVVSLFVSTSLKLGLCFYRIYQIRFKINKFPFVNTNFCNPFEIDQRRLQIDDYFP
jgi:hypothetical protein